MKKANNAVRSILQQVTKYYSVKVEDKTSDLC